MLSPKGIELELPTLRDRATGVLNELPLSFSRKSRSSGEKMEGNGVSEARGVQRIHPQRKSMAKSLNLHAWREGRKGGGVGEERKKREMGGRRGRGPIYRRMPRSG